MGKNSKIKIVLLSSALLLCGLVFFAARGAYVSNLLKGLVLTELSAATGRQVLAGKIILNIFPLFIEARDLRVLDNNNGAELLKVPRLKGYVNFSGLLKKELVIRRLVVNGPDIKTDADQVEDLIRHINEFLSVERPEALKVVVKSIVVNEGHFAFGYGEMFFRGSGLGIEAVLGRNETGPFNPGMKFSLKDLTANIKGWPELKAGVKGTAALKGKVVDIDKLELDLYGSALKVSGDYAQGKGGFRLELNLLVESAKKIFGLRQKGDGELFVKGLLNLDDASVSRPVIDLDIKGDIYAQTLMELLKVNEKIEGRLSFGGKLKGGVEKLAGTAAARLRDGNLFGVAIDDLNCKVSYADGRLKFKEGKVSLYNGHAAAEVSVNITGAADYSLNVKFSEVDSPAAFKLAGWDPGIPFGKVNGELSSSGSGFNPSGWFVYRSLSKGADILGRVKSASGSFVLKNDILSISDSKASTGSSELYADGDINISKHTLDLKAQVKTPDVRDLTMPYLKGMTGSGGFTGSVTGRFDNPVLTGTIKLQSAAYEDFGLGDISGEINYKKDLLEVKSMSASNTVMTANVQGQIKFKNADTLFDLKSPFYALTVSMNKADLEKTLRFIRKEPMAPVLRGDLNTAFTITGFGPAPLFKGFAKVTEATAEGIEVGTVTLGYSYDYKTLQLNGITVKKNGSLITAEGTVTDDKRFNFKASGKNMQLADLSIDSLNPQGIFKGSGYIKKLLAGVQADLRIEGKGSFDNPNIELEGSLHTEKNSESSRKLDIVEGSLKASLKGNLLSFNSTLLNEKVTLTGKADMKGDMPWTARLDLRPGRYEFLMSPLFKDSPEDLLINMKCSAELSGDKRHFNADAVISHLNMTLYGYSFSNEAEVRLKAQDRLVTLSSLTMRSGSTSFKAGGNLEIGRGYDLVFEGSAVPLSALKLFSRKIETIKGDAGFVFTVSGGWDSPKVNGGITLANGFFALKDVPYRISSISGYLYVDENKIVIKECSGKTGGGDIDISGIAYLQRFKLKRFYVNAELKNIGAGISKDFSANFDGNLLYKGNLDSQALSGEVRINRAKYMERIEWKSWLLSVKPKEKPRAEATFFEKTSLNIRLYSPENILIDNNIARATFKLDLLLRGSIAYPVILGRVESRSGFVFFRNNEFRIINVNADFSDPKRTNPLIEVVAETAIKGYNIRMHLEGQFEHFNLSLSSDPPLEEIDILSLLAIGRLGKEIKGIEGGIGAGEATSFLTGKMQDVLEERLKTMTGLDRLEVDPYISKTTGSVNPRVTVSKRLLGDRLFVTYSSTVGSTENNVVKLEYLLGRNISLVGVRDEKGSLGGDIKYRFEFR